MIASTPDRPDHFLTHGCIPDHACPPGWPTYLATLPYLYIAIFRPNDDSEGWRMWHYDWPIGERCENSSFLASRDYPTTHVTKLL